MPTLHTQYLMLHSVTGTYCLQIDYYLTAMVPIFQEYDGRRNVVTVENRSGLKETTLLIEGFKPGLSLCLFVTIQ